MSVNERRNEIMRILRTGKLTTIPQLVEQLRSSRSTIKRDILALTVDEEYPIDTIQGNGGGVILRDFRHPHKHILSQEQIKVLEEIAETANTYHSEVLKGILSAYA